MRYKECALDLASVWILTLTVENLFIQIDVVDVHCTIECQCDHLWHLCWLNVSRNAGSVGRAKTVGNCTLVGVASVNTKSNAKLLMIDFQANGFVYCMRKMETYSGALRGDGMVVTVLKRNKMKSNFNGY